MNRMIVVVFDNEASAEAATRALRHLDDEGDITLYALGVIAKDLDGTVKVKKTPVSFALGAGTGLAVGGLIGLLGGPLGVVVGAATGSLLGTVRDYWVAGVALDFVEEASNFLQPGKTAVVAEVEEEWATPIDAAMRALGGVVIRRARIDALQAQFDADIVAVKTEIAQLEAEGKHASRTAQQHLVTSLAAAHADLAKTKQSATHKLSVFKQETDARVRAIEVQVGKARGDARSRIEARLERVRSAYVERTAKLSQAWGLAKEALST